MLPFKQSLTISALSILLTAVPNLASARNGGSDGGGGGAVLCLNADHSVKSAKLVDLVESAFYDKLLPSAELANLPWQKQLELAAKRISFVDPDFHQRVTGNARASDEAIEEYLKDTKDTDLYFPAPQDLSLGRTPPLSPGCQIVGAAVYSDSEDHHQASTLRLSHLVWKNLSARDKAGLLLHEAVYLAQRDIYRALGLGKVESSAATRVLVGLAFSTVLDGNPGPKAEPARFNSEGHFRGYRLAIGYDEESAFFPDENDRVAVARVKLYKALRTTLPYLLQGASRPVYLSREGCKEGYHLGLVDDRRAYRTPEPGRRCELRVESFNRVTSEYGVKGAKGEVMKPLKVNKHGLVTTYLYKYTPEVTVSSCSNDESSCGEERQKLTLKCRTNASAEDYTPPLTLYCGKRPIATTEKGPSYEGTWEKQELSIYGKFNFTMEP